MLVKKSYYCLRRSANGTQIHAQDLIYLNKSMETYSIFPPTFACILKLELVIDYHELGKAGSHRGKLMRVAGRMLWVLKVGTEWFFAAKRMCCQSSLNLFNIR